MMSDRRSAHAAKDETAFTLVDQLLAEQQTLSAVDRFSALHDRNGLPAMAKHYKALLPSAPPGPGQQYAFEVNLDACTGCKACVSACHALNGLDEDEAWRDVGLLLGGRRNDAYQQVVTTACHHCADPGCLNGCPVAAYEKEADTGIVRHLDDQCIGCQYCVLKCPYDVPKYSDRLGIVRKCDMCVGRLREGEAPACVQACPTGAIRIRVVDKADLAFNPGTRMLPGAFDSSYTQPSTIYKTNKEMPRNTRPADANALRFEHAHWPLIGMLVLSQMSAGIFVVVAGLMLAGVLASSWAPLVYAATAALNIGLGISVLHLGRPFGAWRFFLGLRTSWMSREILAFSVFAGAAGGAATAFFFHLPVFWVQQAVVASAVLGLAAVFTSVMIYVDTHRPFWSAGMTHAKFYGTVLTLGLTTAAVVSFSHGLLLASLAVRTLLYAWEQASLRAALGNEACPWHASVRVIKNCMPRLMNARDGVYFFSLILAVPALATPQPMLLPWALILLTAIAARVMERYVFFVASMGSRMTGGYKA